MKNHWNTSVFIGAIGAWAVLQGCAHSGVQTRIDQKLAAEPEFRGTAELQKKAGELIENAPGLSPEQRDRLARLRDSTGQELGGLHQQSMKLRALLIQDVISPKYDATEVSSVQDRLRKLENRRLTIIFAAVEQANRILGHEAPAHERIMRDFIEPPGAR